MSFALSVSNRQRKLKVDIARLEQLFVSVAQATYENLVAKPAKRLKITRLEKILPTIARRGILSIVLVSNSQIQKLNRTWRHKDVETDVISFPLALDIPPGDTSWEFGEIFISLEKAAEQADSFEHSLDRELAFLFVHGCLHVFGFDHETAADEKEMFGRQEEILHSVGLSR